MTTFIAVVPGVPALLPTNQGRVDAVSELRAACLAAVTWLTDRSPAEVAVACDAVVQPRAMEVATSLLAQVGFSGDVTVAGQVGDADNVLVVANGSARRGEGAPGHLDPRSFDFDNQIEAALARGDAAALAGTDLELGAVLLAEGLGVLSSLSSLAGARIAPTLLYADDPYGVRYWVVTWDCEF